MQRRAPTGLQQLKGWGKNAGSHPPPGILAEHFRWVRPDGALLRLRFPWQAFKLLALQILAPVCRVTQLEEEVNTWRSRLQAAQSELAGKEADNVSLYEKIRYLQRYSSNRQASSSDSSMTIVQVDEAGVAQPEVGISHCCDRR